MRQISLECFLQVGQSEVSMHMSISAVLRSRYTDDDPLVGKSEASVLSAIIVILSNLYRRGR